MLAREVRSDAMTTLDNPGPAADGAGHHDDSVGTILVLAPADADPAGCPDWLASPTPDSESPMTVGDTASGARASTDASAADPSTTALRVDLSRNGALGALGETLLDRLDASAGTDRVCVDGLTAVVRDRGTETAFRVLLALRAAVRGRQGRVHVHLDPARVDARTRRTLAHGVDAVVRFDGTDPVVVRDPGSGSKA